MTAIQIAAIIAAYLLAFARLANAARPLWAWAPKIVQVVLPALVIVIPDVVAALAGVHSQVDLSVVLLTAISTVAAAVRGSHPELPGPIATANARTARLEDVLGGPRSKPLTAWKYAWTVGCFAVLAIAMTGCSGKGSVWPTVAHCVPGPSSLLSKVEDVLLAGDDYESVLERLALTEGGAAVACAVDSLVSAWTAPAGRARVDDEYLSAASRGRAFLAKKGTSVERPAADAGAQ